MDKSSAKLIQAKTLLFQIDTVNIHVDHVISCLLHIWLEHL